MDSTRPGFDFTAAMRRLCQDTVERLPDLGHINMSRVALSVSQTRQNGPRGTHASLTPLRFESGARRKRLRGVLWEVSPLLDDQGCEYLYLLSFYLPRFQNNSLEEKLSTVFHELWHIGPTFDGDLRRYSGRYYAHGPSQRDYDAQMACLAQEWLGRNPPGHLYEFLLLDFRELIAEYGRVVGSRWPAPRLVRC